jgi:DNA-binding response OmpR family regulator
MQKVMVVEDDATIATLIRRVLEDDGFMVVQSDTLEGAWSSMLSEDPDAALVDLRLSWSESGWDLVERIRDNEHFHNLPIVVVTGATGQEVVDRARSYGAEYVNKPFSPVSLVDRLRYAMRAAGRIPQLRPWRVSLLMDGYRIDGTIHCPPELDRFSDAWEAIVRDAREYIPVTGATVSADNAGTSIKDAPVVEVRKDRVLGAYATS